MFWVFIFLAVMVRTKGDTAADPVLLEALRYYKRDHGCHMPFSIFKRDHHAGQSRWTKLKKVVDKEEKLPAVNFELPASRVAEDDLVLPASRIADDDLVSFICEHLDMPDPDIQARWGIEPARVQRCRHVHSSGCVGIQMTNLLFVLYVTTKIGHEIKCVMCS